jgi:hypothetical protein
MKHRYEAVDLLVPALIVMLLMLLIATRVSI